MGMLTLAGAVSGGGKALQQGLQQTQQYMSQSLLLKERDDMERARMDITYGREVGLLQMRNKLETERDDRQHSRQMDRDERREDFEMRKGDVERKASREDATTQFERQRERDVTNKVLESSYQQQRDAEQAKKDRAKEERARNEKRAEMEHETGRQITLKSMELSKPSHAGGSASGETAGKWDDTKKARYKLLANKIAAFDERKALGAKLTDAEQREYDFLQRELNAMADIPVKERPQYRFPD